MLFNTLRRCNKSRYLLRATFIPIVLFTFQNNNNDYHNIRLTNVLTQYK